MYLLTRSNRLLPSLHAGLRKSKTETSYPIYVFGDARVISARGRPFIRCEETHPRRTAIPRFGYRKYAGFSRAAPRHHHCNGYRRRPQAPSHVCRAFHSPPPAPVPLEDAFPVSTPAAEPHPVERALYFPTRQTVPSRAARLPTVLPL